MLELPFISKVSTPGIAKLITWGKGVVSGEGEFDYF